MRTKLGWAVAGLGVLCALVGLAAMVVLGPDSRFTTGPHAIETDGIAVVTAPKVISWADVQIDVLAEVPVRKPVFVGLGNSVDVQDYVGKTARLEVTGFHTPWKATTRQVEGKPNLAAAPTALDWWLADSAGLGGAGISTTLPDQTVSVAILAVGATDLSGLEVTLAYGIKGGFVKGLGLLLLGAGGILAGALLRRDELPDGEPEYDEEVFVYLDEHGIEHEISAEEARGYEVVEEEIFEEVVDVDVEPATEPVREPDNPERVVYVFVDEHGVEHEVGEDELADFEVVDEEDQP